MCEIDITYFPFDDQTCALVFGAWSYHTTKMNLTNSSNVVNLDSYERNGEWEIITTEVGTFYVVVGILLFYPVLYCCLFL